jgi:hypothetical protein
MVAASCWSLSIIIYDNQDAGRMEIEEDVMNAWLKISIAQLLSNMTFPFGDK